MRARCRPERPASRFCTNLHVTARHSSSTSIPTLLCKLLKELEAARIELANKGFAERFLGVLQGVVQCCRVAESTTYANAFQPTTPHTIKNCLQNRLHPDFRSFLPGHANLRLMPFEKSKTRDP
jgi:hypothetical protein